MKVKVIYLYHKTMSSTIQWVGAKGFQVLLNTEPDRTLLHSPLEFHIVM